jgi:hypothetical protein
MAVLFGKRGPLVERVKIGPKVAGYLHDDLVGIETRDDR